MRTESLNGYSSTHNELTIAKGQLLNSVDAYAFELSGSWLLTKVQNCPIFASDSRMLMIRGMGRDGSSTSFGQTHFRARDTTPEIAPYALRLLQEEHSRAPGLRCRAFRTPLPAQFPATISTTSIPAITSHVTTTRNRGFLISRKNLSCPSCRYGSVRWSSVRVGAAGSKDEDLKMRFPRLVDVYAFVCICGPQFYQ